MSVALVAPWIHTDTQTHTQTLQTVRGGSCVDQFRLYEGSRLLKIGPEGHQMGVKQRSAPSRRGRGLGHEQGGLYTQHVARGALWEVSDVTCIQECT